MSVNMLRSELLATVPGVVHAFTTRKGGESRGDFSSLNLSARVGDDKAAVERNRDAVLSRLERADATWITVKQVHGDTAVEVTRQAGKSIEADALWTRDAGAMIGVLVADCVPLLMASEDGRAVAAVHAGWRGTKAKVAVRMIERLRDVAVLPAQLRVAIGPAIGPCCFEIGDEVADELRAALPSATQHVKRRDDGKLVADLWALNHATLVEAGVLPQHIEQLRQCTACTPDAFFSHRRDQGKTGRQAAVIAPRLS